MGQRNAALQKARIRKVFRKDDAFLCGMCGSNYGQQAEAEACLSRCVEAQLASGEDIAESAPKRYRCSFCRRVYSDLDSAKDCSRQCRKTIEHKMAKESHVLQSMSKEEKLQALLRFAKEANATEALKEIQQAGGQMPKKNFRKPPGMLPGEGVKFMRDKHMFRCLRCKQRYSQSKEASNCFDQHGESYKPPVQSKPREDSHKFFRDSAKYRCQKCHSGFFSGDDAAQCYDAHPADYVRKIKATTSQDAGEATEGTLAQANESGSEQPSAAEAPIAAAASPQAKKKKDGGDDHIYYRDAAKYVCRGCDKKYFTREDVVTCFESHPKGGEDAAEAQTQAPQLDDAEMFLRDGAKYVCKTCRAKYFTRVEVIQCFQSHS